MQHDVAQRAVEAAGFGHVDACLARNGTADPPRRREVERRGSHAGASQPIVHWRRLTACLRAQRPADPRGIDTLDAAGGLGGEALSVESSRDLRALDNRGAFDRRAREHDVTVRPRPCAGHVVRATQACAQRRNAERTRKPREIDVRRAPLQVDGRAPVARGGQIDNPLGAQRCTIAASGCVDVRLAALHAGRRLDRLGAVPGDLTRRHVDVESADQRRRIAAGDVERRASGHVRRGQRRRRFLEPHVQCFGGTLQARPLRLDVRHDVRSHLTGLAPDRQLRLQRVERPINRDLIGRLQRDRRQCRHERPQLSKRRLVRGQLGLDDWRLLVVPDDTRQRERGFGRPHRQPLHVHVVASRGEPAGEAVERETRFFRAKRQMRHVECEVDGLVGEAALEIEARDVAGECARGRRLVLDRHRPVADADGTDAHRTAWPLAIGFARFRLQELPEAPAILRPAKEDVRLRDANVVEHQPARDENRGCCSRSRGS